MKTIVLLGVLSILGASYAAVTRANLNIGYIAAGDRLLHRQNLYQPAILNTIQYQDMIYRGNFTNRVTAIRAAQVGYTQYASAWVIGGGVGSSNVTVRVQSARGYGYYYTIEIWGR